MSEVSGLARNTLQVLEIGRECITRGVHLHVAKNGIVFDDSMQSKIVAMVLGLMAEIERDFISARTKEPLAKHKQLGFTQVTDARCEPKANQWHQAKDVISEACGVGG